MLRQDSLICIIINCGEMRFGAISKTYPSYLEKEVGDDKKDFGPKLQAFSK